MLRISYVHQSFLTYAAVDNSDHNQSSATAKTSFHEPSITIFQHKDYPAPNVPIPNDMNNSITSKTKLSSYFNNIEPSKAGKPEPRAVLMS